MAEEKKLHRYVGANATVTWDAKRCIHAAECVRGLPSVFNAKATPWVQPADAAADTLAATVFRCPTGALHLERNDGAHEPVSPSNVASVTPDGPTYFRGDLQLFGQDGNVALTDTRMALCRCGASANKPLCDGSHRKAGFHQDGTLHASESSPAVGAGPLAIRARPNGPLICTGPLTITGTNGLAAYAETTFLCRCGGSANKPYCDGTHKRNGFVG